ncbi:MAG: hypothetical protein NTX50_20235 [Candidatus Sumerlaeota bacterium]|nr:hypothetical protein [Candidatus Sumerlaeota bacterium]
MIFSGESKVRTPKGTLCGRHQLGLLALILSFVALSLISPTIIWATADSNNTKETAQVLTVNQNIGCSLNKDNDPIDWFKCDYSSYADTGCVFIEIDGSADPSNIAWILYDGDGVTMLDYGRISSDPYSKNIWIDLDSSFFYLRIEYVGSLTGNQLYQPVFRFGVGDDNNTPETAQELQIGERLGCTVNKADDRLDIFKCHYTQAGKMSVGLSSTADDDNLYWILRDAPTGSILDSGTIGIKPNSSQYTVTVGNWYYLWVIYEGSLSGDQAYIPEFAFEAPPDSVPPQVTLTHTTNVIEITTSKVPFSIRYTDNVAVRASDIDSNDILVTGPNSFSQLAEMFAATPTDGSPIDAVYRVSPPSVTWTSADNGTYNINMQANQVRDTSNNYVAAGLLGSFEVNIPSAIYTLAVNSSGASGVGIGSTTSHGGTTNYTKTGLASGASVNLSAPSTDPTDYTFARWRLDAVDQTAGQKTLNFTMTGNRTAEAVYTPTAEAVYTPVVVTYTLTVNSTGASGVGIGSTTSHGGTTNYTKTGLASGASVNLSAPSTDPTDYTFARWRLDAVDQTAGQKTLNFTMTGNRTAEAVYTPAEDNYYPGDSNSDWSISISEITAYGAAWKRGDTWPVPPNPIPIGYVTRGGMIWKSSEVYHYDSGQSPPACWISGLSAPGFRQLTALQSPRAFSVLGATSTLRTLPSSYSPGLAVNVSIAITPDSGASVWAVEETPPSGWTVSGINEGGNWDSVNQKIKWGPYFDTTARTLSYAATPPASETGTKAFSGIVSVDGVNQTIAGNTSISPGSGNSTAVRSITNNNTATPRISIAVTPASGVSNYAVEDALPSGITPSVIDNSGTWDSVNRKVKWGPFFDATARTLSYTVSGLAGVYTFTGTASFDGTNSTITGTNQATIAGGNSTAVRSITNNNTAKPGISIAVTPASGVSNYAVEDTLPSDITPSGIDSSGSWDSVNRKVKWGPFFDATARTLNYTVSGSAGAYPLIGTASFSDGQIEPSR